MDDFSDKSNDGVFDPLGTIVAVFSSWQWFISSGVLSIVIYAKTFFGGIEQVVEFPAEFYLAVGLMALIIGGHKFYTETRTNYEVELCQ